MTGLSFDPILLNHHNLLTNLKRAFHKVDLDENTSNRVIFIKSICNKTVLPHYDSTRCYFMLLVKTSKRLSTNPEPDKEAIENAKKDPKAFEVLYKKYFKGIYRFVHKKVQDDQESEDLVSKVFIKSFQGIKSFEYQGIPYSAWLYRVAMNESNQYFRKNKTRHVVIDDKLGDSIALEIDWDTEREALLKNLPSVISSLNTNELELIEMRFYEDMSYKQMGFIIGITETNCRVKTHRALQKLKRLLSNG